MNTSKLFYQIELNITEFVTLACTRNYLLLKLLSGAIEVKVAAEQMEKLL